MLWTLCVCPTECNKLSTVWSPPALLCLLSPAHSCCCAASAVCLWCWLAVRRNVDKYPEAEKTPGIVIVRLDAPLFFANTAHFENSIERHVQKGQREAHEAGRESHPPLGGKAAAALRIAGLAPHACVTVSRAVLLTGLPRPVEDIMACTSAVC